MLKPVTCLRAINGDTLTSEASLLSEATYVAGVALLIVIVAL